MHAALVYAVMGMAFKGMGAVSKNKTAPAESETNAENNNTLDNLPRLTYDEITKLPEEQLKNYADDVNKEYVEHLKDTTNFTDEQIQSYVGETVKDTSRAGTINRIFDLQNELGDKNNINVTKIIIIDPETGEETILFERR